VVVLHEIEIDPVLGKGLPLPSFHEKPALVAKNTRLDDHDVRNFRFDELHRLLPA